jgi:hypothetical protein
MSGGIVPPIVNPNTRCGWVVSFTSRPLYSHQKSPVYPFNRGGENPKVFGEEKNLLPLSLDIEEYLGSNEIPVHTTLHKIRKLVITDRTDGVTQKIMFYFLLPLTEGGDLCFAQVDVPPSGSHSCVWPHRWAPWQLPTLTGDVLMLTGYSQAEGLD